MKPYYEMALRMQDAGTIMDYSTLKTGNIAYASPFQQGTVATLPMGTWFSTMMITKAEAGETDVNWGIATLPHPEGVEAGNTVGSTTPMAVDPKLQTQRRSMGICEDLQQVKQAQPLRLKEDRCRLIRTIRHWKQSPEKKSMPEGAAEALKTTNIVLDRPIDSKSAEINQMLSEEHSLIMIKEKPIDDVLGEMGKRAKEIQGE